MVTFELLPRVLAFMITLSTCSYFEGVYLSVVSLDVTSYYGAICIEFIANDAAYWLLCSFINMLLLTMLSAVNK